MSTKTIDQLRKDNKLRFVNPENLGDGAGSKVNGRILESLRNPKAPRVTVYHPDDVQQIHRELNPGKEPLVLPPVALEDAALGMEQVSREEFDALGGLFAEFTESELAWSADVARENVAQAISNGAGVQCLQFWTFLSRLFLNELHHSRKRPM